MNRARQANSELNEQTSLGRIPEKKCFKRVAESTALIVSNKLGTFPAARTPGQLEFHEINSLRCWMSLMTQVLGRDLKFKAGTVPLID